MQLWGSLSILWHYLSLGLEWKHLFQFCDHCWVFQICWHIECNSFTASSFRIWNSSPGIPSPPLALFVVMLPKALPLDFTFQNVRLQVGDHTIMIIWVMKIFLYSSSVYSCHFFLISSASVDPYHFCPLLCLFYHPCNLTTSVSSYYETQRHV